MSAAVASINPDTRIAVPAWVWGPAGRDIQLARAISDLTTGGYLGSTRELLASVRRNPERRAYCTSALAALLVRRRLGLAEQWVQDEPTNPDALLLIARVLVVRTIHAVRAGESGAAELGARAVRACQEAGLARVSDPTPWVALLHLGETRLDLPELRCGIRSPGEDLTIYAPWHLLDGVLQRTAHHREAFHRLIPLCFTASSEEHWTPGSAEKERTASAEAARARAQVAVWAADQAPAGSPLKLLRLMYAAERDPYPDRAEEMRLSNHLHWNGESERESYLSERVPAIEQRWRRALRGTAIKLADAWFIKGEGPPYVPLADLSFLADYLHRAGEFVAARPVLEWMIPYATAEPWQRRGDPGEVLAKVCLECDVNPALLPR